MPKFEITSPSGRRYEVVGPEGATEQEALERVQAEHGQQNLLSLEGVKSTLQLVGPGLARGILGSQLAGLEEMQTAREARRQKGETVEIDEEEKERLESIKIKRQAIKEADVDISRIRGEPSRPLSIAQDVVQSIAGNAPGVAAAVVGRAAGPAAIAPGLMSAGEQTFGQEYATARVGKDATVEAARRHAGTSEVAEIGFEMLPMSWLIKNLGKTGTVEFAAKYVARELATELPTTATQKISERINVEPDKPMAEFLSELKDDLIQTALVTPFAAGAMSLGAKGMVAAGGGAGKPKPPPESPATAEFVPETPPPPVGPRPIVRSDNSVLSAPTPALTTVPDSATKAQLDALIASIDETLITKEDVDAARKTLDAATTQAETAQQLTQGATWKPLSMVPGELTMDASDVGASRKQEATAAGYVNPNVGERLERDVLWSSIGEEGVPLGSVAMQPGTFAIGRETADRPAEYMVAAAETLESWRQQLMPEATLVLSNEQLPSTAVLGANYTAGNLSFIVPGVLRGVKTPGEFNANARATSFLTLAHEFGHTLMEQRLWGAMSPELAAIAKQQGLAGPISEETLAQMPALEQAVLREFSALRQAIENGTMTAQQFVETWLSPGKMARTGQKEPGLGKNWLKDLGVAPSAPAKQVAQALARRTVKGQGPEQDLKVQTLVNQYLSPDEYLAEQTARAAYKNKWDVGSPLEQYLQKAVESLRKFFRMLKQEKVIKPGTAFQEWLDSLTATGKGTAGDQAAQVAKMKGAPEKKAKVKTAKTPKPKRPRGAPTKASQEQKEHMLRMLTTLELAEAVPEDAARRMYDLIEEGDFDGFVEAFQPYAAKNVKFELDKEDLDFTGSSQSVLRAGISEKESGTSEAIAEAFAEWKEKQFRSRFFKAWFGDWEGDPQNASKIRRGAIIRSPVTGGFRDISEDISGDAPRFGTEPLIVYHGTRTSFPAFTRGDLGFHFGTVRAAHNRLGDYPTGTQEFKIGVWPSQRYPEKASIIPAVLNIRNPLYAGHETTDNSGSLWLSPPSAMRWLFNRGIITPEIYAKYAEEATRLWSTGIEWNTVYQSFEPVRRALIEAGYDGVVYENPIEGDVSFIALAPNQVKSLLGSRTFSRSDNMHWELDYDASTPEGDGVSKWYKGVKNFLPNPGPVRMAVRRMQRGLRHGFQMQQMVHMNPALSWLQMFGELIPQYNARKSTAQAPADRVVGKWEGPYLGKENAARMASFVGDMRHAGELWFDLVKHGPEWRYQPNERTLAEFNKRGIDETAGEIVLDAYNAHLHQLQMLQNSLMAVARTRYTKPELIQQAGIIIKDSIHQIRKIGSWPGGRFGKMMLTVERQTSSKRWEVVHKEAFEDAGEWDRAWREASARVRPDERVRKHELKEQDYVILGLPKDFLDVAASELNLSDEQVERLAAVLQPARVEKALTKYDLERLKLAGYSKDELRTFADHSWHNANLIAKIEFRALFKQAIDYGRAELRTAELSNTAPPDEVVRLGGFIKAMEESLDFMMAPQYEAQTLRMMVSVMYLGLNVKTAVVNLFGLLPTWSDLTTRFGQIEGNARFLRAIGKSFSTFKWQLSEARKTEFLKPDEQDALDKSLEEGVTSQNYAYHLAGMANASSMWRLPATNSLQKITRAGIDVAMFPFRLTDLFTRRVAFLAQYEAARDRPQGLTDPYTEAVRKTGLQQGEYSHGNRAGFMRGGAFGLGPTMPIATIFMTWMQNMMWHAYGGYELGERRRAKLEGRDPAGPLAGYTAKIWLVLLLLAGYEGLPGAENLLDLITAAWRKLGGQKPIRQHLREYVKALDIPGLSPGLAAHGLTHDIGGFDISRSLGLGRFVPGTDVLAQSRTQSEEQMAMLILDMFGPAGGFLRFGWTAVHSDKPLPKIAEGIPGGAGNIYNAYRWSQRGVVAGNLAKITIDPQTGKPRDLTPEEILGKALGFNPTIVSQNREMLRAQYDARVYWTSQRDMLLDSIYDAYVLKDREAQADSKRNIEKFNANIPAEYRSLRITGATIAQSRIARDRARRATEQQTTPQRTLKPVFRDIKESYSP